MQVLKTKLSRPSMLNGRAMQRPQLLIRSWTIVSLLWFLFTPRRVMEKPR